MAENERTSGTVAEVPAQRERPHRARQRVRGDGEADEEADFPRRRRSYGKPRDRDGAHPVAERRDAEPGQQQSGSTVS